MTRTDHLPPVRRHHLGPIGDPVAAAVAAVTAAAVIGVFELSPWIPATVSAVTIATVAAGGYLVVRRSRVGDHVPAATFRTVCWSVAGLWVTGMPLLGWPILGFLALAAAAAVGVALAPAVAHTH
jgi:hypothetical protein